MTPAVALAALDTTPHPASPAAELQARALLQRARQADEPATLAEVAEELARRVACLKARPADEAGRWLPAWLALVPLVQRCVLAPELHVLAEWALEAPPGNAETEGRLQAGTVALLQAQEHLRQTVALDPLLVRAGQRWPEHAGLALLRARRAASQGAGADAVLALAAPAGAAGDRWLATYLFYRGDAEASLARFQALQDAGGALSPHERLRLAHLRARDPHPDDQALSPPPPLVPADWPGLVPLLTGLVDLMARPVSHGSEADDPALQAAVNLSLGRWEEGLRQVDPAEPPLPPGRLLALAQALWQHAELAWANAAALQHAYPYELHPGHGGTRSARCAQLHRAVLAHVALLCEWATARPHPLRQTPEATPLKVWLDLLERGTAARLALDQAETARQHLQTLRARTPGPAGQPLDRLLLQCALSQTPGAATPLADRASTHALQSWDDWSAGMAPAPVAPVCHGPLADGFEVTRPDGTCLTWPHQTAATRFNLVAAGGPLQVRLSSLLINPRGAVLRDLPWKVAQNQLLARHPSVLALGRQGLALAAVADVGARQVHEPVVVLAQMDVAQDPNYYHWMLLQLARLNALQAAGVLTHRRVLLPQELAPWMEASLALIGLPPERVLRHHQDESLCLHDAWVAAPVDTLPAPLMRALRDGLWHAAGLDPAAPPPAHRKLFLSRLHENRRPLVNEAALQALAQAQGYEIVAPETLPLLDQVRLFASARAVAGPPGAAQTNLLWMQPGTRVLSLFKTEQHLPVFVELSNLVGQQHRWLVGPTLPAFATLSVVNGPFEVDPALAADALAWAARTDPAPPPPMNALPDALSRLHAWCLQHQQALPVDLAAWRRLAQPQAPAAERVALARAVNTRWDAQPPGDEPTFRAVQLAVVEHALADQGPAQRLACGLLPIRAKAAAVLGHVGVLHAMLDAWGPQLAEPALGPLLSALLWHVRRAGDEALCRRLLASLPDPTDPALDARRQPLASLLAGLAREGRELDTLRTVARWLERLTPWLETDHQAPPPNQAARQVITALAQAALSTAQPDVLRRLVQWILTTGSAADMAAPLLNLLRAWVQWAPGPQSHQAVTQAGQALPRHPGIQALRMRLAHESDAPLAELAAMMADLDPALPGHEHALRQWIGYLGHDDVAVLAAWQSLAAHHPLPPRDAARMQMLALRVAAQQQQQGSDAATTDATAVPEAIDAPRQALLPLADLATALAEALDPLAHWVEQVPDWRAGGSLAGFEAEGRAQETALRAALTRLEDIPWPDTLPALRRLLNAARSGTPGLGHYCDLFPQHQTPAFGTLDVLRARVQRRTLHACAWQLGRWRLERDLEQSSWSAGALAPLLEGAERTTDAALALGEAADQAELLARLARHLAPLGRSPLARAQLRCALDRGDLAAARTLQAGQPEDTGAELVAQRDWADWHPGTGRAPRPLLEEPACPGHFDWVRQGGQVQREDYALQPSALHLLDDVCVQVRHSHLLQTADGTLLRPHRWHLAMGDYPYPHARLLQRGQAGARLRPAPAVRTVDEPVLVLANLDATFHRNYYHWMVQTLARVAWLQAHGELAGRRLLLPRELSGWMFGSLQALGLGPDQALLYGAEEQLVLRHAWVASAQEFASPAQMGALRQALWRHAGLDPAHPPALTRRLYLSRLEHGRRPLVGEERIMAIAREHGFECVAPEQLPLAEQVRLFASAAAVAGPSGAGLTNLAWMQAGARVLTLFKEEVNAPTFADLALIGGLQLRYLLGRSLTGHEQELPFMAPYTVAPETTRPHLAWAAESRHP